MMAAKRVRKANRYATKGKVKAWKKGQSSSYNPKCRKFRDQAKQRAVYGYQANSELTHTALAKHDKLLGDDETQSLDDESVTASDATSFASSISKCSNVTFSRLLEHWMSDPLANKQRLSVAAAVNEVIEEKGGKHSDAEYFAALVTFLDAADTNIETRTAALSLLPMFVSRLPASVLKFNFSKTCPLLKDVLLKYADSDLNPLLKNTLKCLYHFLKVEDDGWTESAKDIYTFVLEFVTHHKPRVRKCAQSVIVSLLKTFTSESDEDKPVHPAVSVTARFCISKLESSGSSGSPSVLHILNLLGCIMHCFPRSSLKPACEIVLRMMKLSSCVVMKTCLKALRSMFEHKPKEENLPDELNIKIIKALYDFQPSAHDADLVTEWLNLQETAFINLYRLNPMLCLCHLPHFFRGAVSFWSSTKEEVHPAVSSTLMNIIHSCVVPSSDEFQQLMLDDPVNNAMHKMFQHVESCLIYKYIQAWKHALAVLAAFFDVMGKHSHRVMMQCLRSLADLRDTFNFPCTAELDKTIGVAIQRMGPEVVLQAVPLQIKGENDRLDFPRSWLLPLLRDNVKETRLQFFADYFYPLASRLRAKVKEYEQQKRVVEAKVYDTIYLQIWSLLPGFCTSPTDLKRSFKSTAKMLASCLREQPDLRITVLSSLRVLISKNLQNEENVAEIATQAKNFLPILLNMYTTESKDKSEEGVRLATFDTIKAFLQVTDREMCQYYFNTAMSKIKDGAPPMFKQHAVLDVCRALSPYLDEKEMKELYEYCKPLVQSKDTHHTVQKKSYAVISELCGSKTAASLSFVKNNIEDLKSLLLTSLSTSAAPSKAMRLSCLNHLIQQLTEDNREFLVAVIPEAVLCTKATAEKAKTMAYKLIGEIGACLKKWRPENPKEAVREYVALLRAGLGGRPNAMSATNLAIAHVIREFKEDLDTDMVHLLVADTSTLLSVSSREIVASALTFMEVLLKLLDSEILAQHVEDLINGIGQISQDNQRYFRFRAKELFTRLVRKFGYEMISKLVPPQFQKQLVNIRKMEARKARKKNMSEDDSEVELESESQETKTKSDMIDDILQDSDEDAFMDSEDDEPAGRAKGKGILKKKRKPSAWIAESAENEILDLMDPSVSRKILATKPTEKKKKPKVTFETTEDGRIVIPDEKESKVGQKRKREDDEMDDAAVSFAEAQAFTKSKKLKTGDADDQEEDEKESMTVKQNQKPVLRGLRRTVKNPQKPPGIEFKAKKAGGDVKRGKLDPYAYVPLNRQFLNKRKSKKLAGQFKGIVRAAKHGAQKGAKRKARNARKK